MDDAFFLLNNFGSILDFFSFGQGKMYHSLAGQYSVNFIRASRRHLLSLFEDNALSHPFLQFMVTLICMKLWAISPLKKVTEDVLVLT